MAHSNPHSPPEWRVNGVIVNQPGFAAAFSCKAGAPMNPREELQRLVTVHFTVCALVQCQTPMRVSLAWKHLGSS